MSERNFHYCTGCKNLSGKEHLFWIETIEGADNPKVTRHIQDPFCPLCYRYPDVASKGRFPKPPLTKIHSSFIEKIEEYKLSGNLLENGEDQDNINEPINLQSFFNKKEKNYLTSRESNQSFLANWLNCLK